ncbi:adenosine deaminase [Kutzneria viridogrisea]|uniref:Adenine deaminase n=2 Tax=Kutzneria TaxID=43356 RepID=W5W0P9_9PSEU|nr:adenosine deaminase [Kutzneria albida]AHH94733.1 putative deaminase [Kutzneria albida DSM 43870]MBA8930402.1 adenosine deaminase [Kutzneria viridogrisea]
MSELAEFIRDVPKCELHLHIEGTLEPELKFELAARNGVTLPYPDAAALRASYSFHDLASFLVGYYDGVGVVRTEQDFYDLAWAYLSKAHSQRVRYAEVFFDPQAHTSRGVEFGTVVRGLRRALVDARRLLDLRAELIMCFLRDFSAEYAMATLMESLPFRDWIIGVGLDSDERGNPPAKFAAVFARARAEGYLLTAHCDVDQENSVAHIRQCLDEIGVDRIDHGINALDDPELPGELLRRGIGLTVCPVSNRFVTGRLHHEAVRRLLDLGLRVTVNSDDPAYFDAYLTENLLALHEAMDLTRQEVIQLQRNAFEIAWLPARVRDGYLAELTAYGS